MRGHGPGRATGARRMNKLHVDIAGSGPPLVLLHGWAMHGGIFAPLVERLRAHRTLHVVDLPGHGHNRDCGVPLQLEACAHALLDALPDAPWCGWSLGGLIALQAAAMQPARVPRAKLQETILRRRCNAQRAFMRDALNCER